MFQLWKWPGAIVCAFSISLRGTNTELTLAFIQGIIGGNMHNGKINLPLEEGCKGHGELPQEESCWLSSCVLLFSERISQWFCVLGEKGNSILPQTSRCMWFIITVMEWSNACVNIESNMFSMLKPSAKILCTNSILCHDALDLAEPFQYLIRL